MKSNIFHDDTENQYYINNTNTAQRNEGTGNLIMEDINKALGELNENLRTPFMLSYTGYKYEEIATRLRLPLGTVKVRIHNARKELSAKLSVYREYSQN